MSEQFLQCHDCGGRGIRNRIATCYTCAGTGRITQAQDDAYYAKKLAKRTETTLNVVRPVAAPISTRPTAYVCRRCGQLGHAGQYPFSTIAGGDVCDDCI